MPLGVDPFPCAVQLKSETRRECEVLAANKRHAGIEDRRVDGRSGPEREQKSLIKIKSVEFGEESNRSNNLVAYRNESVLETSRSQSATNIDRAPSRVDTIRCHSKNGC